MAIISQVIVVRTMELKYSAKRGRQWHWQAFMDPNWRGAHNVEAKANGYVVPATVSRCGKIINQRVVMLYASAQSSVGYQQ